LKDIETNPY